MNERIGSNQWIDSSKLIPEESLLIAAGLRDVLRLSPYQVKDFLNSFWNMSTHGLSMQVKLANARSQDEYPYDMHSSIAEDPEKTDRFLRIIEERTGLMAKDIEAMYEINSHKHTEYRNRWFDRIKWTPEVLTVFAGLVKFCCKNDVSAAMSLLLVWLGKEHKDIYRRPSSSFNYLVKTHANFAHLLKSERWDEATMHQFEKLLQSGNNTEDWTIQKLLSTYEKRNIDWKDSRNQLLWAGLTRYGLLSWRQAGVFLDAWFETTLPRQKDGIFVGAYSAIRSEGKSLNDIAPDGDSSEAEARKSELEHILSEKGWTLARVIDLGYKERFKNKQ